MELYLGNIIPLASLDFPKGISFVVFFAGCNFKCEYCYNFSILEFKKEFLNETENVKEEINKNKEFIENIVFSGGEPCLQETALIELLEYAKSVGLKTAIETNGSKPEVIKRLIDKKLIDFIALDVKTPFEKDIFEKVTKSKTFFIDSKEVMDKIKKTLRILKENEDKIKIEIRTTIIPSLMYRKEDLFKIAKEIKGFKCKWVLQQFVKKENVLENINQPKIEFLNNLKDLLQKKYPLLNIEVRKEE